jgi:adhesin transport system outer membrane protein
MPKSREEAVTRGLSASPQVKAGLENILSASREVGVKRAGYYPRLDAYATADRERNLEGVAGVAKHSAYGVTADWNIFRGLQDNERVDRAQELYAAAVSLRQRVCHDVRQSLATTFNDYLRLTDQLAFLDQHQLSTDKARQALIKQFEIGQRSLLDVLDTENEFYTARRNYLGGEMDLAIAQMRYLASAGELIKVLGVNRMEMTPPGSEADAAELDALGELGCAAVPPQPGSMNKEMVFQRLKARDDMLRAPQKTQ